MTKPILNGHISKQVLTTICAIGEQHGGKNGYHLLDICELYRLVSLSLYEYISSDPSCQCRIYSQEMI